MDLFTTFDEKERKIIDKFRLFAPTNFIIKKFFTPNVLFIGTSVSEYCILPQELNLNDFQDKLLDMFKKSRRQFLIIKDIPSESPLLTKVENSSSQEIISSLEKNNFIILTGQALAYLPIDFNSIEEYLKKFSSNRRNNFRRKMKLGSKIDVSEINTGDKFFNDEMVGYFYKLYLNVYNNSDVHFDKFTLAFFKQVFQCNKDGKVFIYKVNDKIIGFNLCYIMQDYLVDKYRGSLYPDAEEVALFFNIFFENIKYCLQHNLKQYIIGWTAPRVKAYLGCSFTYTYHAVYIKNPILRYVLKFFKSHFEGDKATICELGKENNS